MTDNMEKVAQAVRYKGLPIERIPGNEEHGIHVETKTRLFYFIDEGSYITMYVSPSDELYFVERVMPLDHVLLYIKKHIK